jgi:hypothetical protein
MSKADCKNCIHRCDTMKDYVRLPFKNMWGEKVDFNCLVRDDELEEQLRLECDEFILRSDEE